MKRSIILLIFLSLLTYSCRSNELREPQKYDYTTSGALTEDCFQVIITVPPDREFKTMADQRENAFIKAIRIILILILILLLQFYFQDQTIESVSRLLLLHPPCSFFSGKVPVLSELPGVPGLVCMPWPHFPSHP